MKKENYDISGMSCAACAARVEKGVRQTEGVEKVSVNLLKNSMSVEYDEGRISSQDIISAVEKAGYGAALHKKVLTEEVAQTKDNKAAKEYKDAKARLILSLVFTVPLFYVAMGHMSGWPLPSGLKGVENAMNFALTQLFARHSHSIYKLQILRERVPCSFPRGSQYGFAYCDRVFRRADIRDLCLLQYLKRSRAQRYRDCGSFYA